MTLPLEMPIEERPRFIINLSQEDYDSLSHKQLEDFLSPLFPKTRASNNTKVEKLTPKKVIAKQYELPGLPNSKDVAALLARARDNLKKQV